jgi:hypothetical protein
VFCRFESFDGGYRFDMYLHDYMVKKKMYKTAAIFKKEADICDNPVGKVLFLAGSYFMSLLFLF